jgi:chromosome segregation protein
MTDSETNDFVAVPLPFQIPEPPDLSKIPLSVIHSATVETLISQTEDLSARLKVQIRRNAVMERRAIELEETTKAQEKQLSAVQQQHEILMEKESSHLEKIKTLEENLSQQKNEIELLEVRYSEQSQVHYKEATDTTTRIAQLEQQVSDLSRLLPLEKENFKLSDDNAFFRTKIEELAQHLQTKEGEVRSFREHTMKLESIINEKTTEVTELKKQMDIQSQEIKKQADTHNKLIEDKSELENLVILKDREKQHETTSLTTETMHARQELKNTLTAFRTIQNENAQMQAQLKSTEETINALSKDNEDLEKQIQNLQGLWYKLQSEFEKERTKTTALTKLNRELSVELQRTKSSPQHDEDFFKRYVNNNRNMDV